MTKPVFRHPDLYQVLPFREYLRNELPHPTLGFVVEDLDIVVRHYGSRYRQDDKGCFMLIEQKHPGVFIGTAQRNTFKLMDGLLREADPEGKRYIGYYVLNIAFDSDNKPIFPVTVNQSHTLPNEEYFKYWLNGYLRFDSLFD